MRKIIASIYSTLDGVIERPGEDGWSLPYFGPDAQEYAQAQLFGSDALLLGRVTYEGFAAAWPSMEAETGDFGVRMNTMPKYVVSRTLERPGWQNTTVLGGDIAEQVGTLREQDGQDLLVFGSGRLTNELIRLGLLDELRLWIHPVVTGRGRRMFPDGTTATFGLAGTTTLSTGVVIATYTPEPLAG
jgi:dihydrofolate reductase